MKAKERTKAKLSFNTAKNNKRAGNITSAYGFVSESAGVDCSGYVSSTYNFSNKQGTYYFRDTLGHKLNSLSNLKQMDFAVKINASGRHVVLYDSRFVQNSRFVYNIYDSTTDGLDQNGGTVKKDKVSKRTVNGDYLKRYTYKTPWCQAGSTL